MARTLGDGWKTAYSKNFRAQILSFEEPSEHGINKGRISKLWIFDDCRHKVVCNYDRGWDLEPTREVEDFYNEILTKYN